MTFEAQLMSRNAADYAEFLLPHLAPDFNVMDVGCGSGSISLGLAKTVSHVTGVDLDESDVTSEFVQQVVAAVHEGATAAINANYFLLSSFQKDD